MKPRLHHLEPPGTALPCRRVAIVPNEADMNHSDALSIQPPVVQLQLTVVSNRAEMQRSCT